MSRTLQQQLEDRIDHMLALSNAQCLSMRQQELVEKALCDEILSAPAVFWDLSTSPVGYGSYRVTRPFFNDYHFGRGLAKFLCRAARKLYTHDEDREFSLDDLLDQLDFVEVLEYLTENVLLKKMQDE